MRHLRISVVAMAWALLTTSGSSVCAGDETRLFDQSAAATLDAEFAADGVSWLLLDGEGQVLARRWENADLPVPPGSLVKPFIALAYGEQHHFSYPNLQCHGTSDHCWLPRGHGWMSLEPAIAQSCNTYFIQLARGLNADATRHTIAGFGLRGPPEGMEAQSWIGLGDRWTEAPLALARAYLHLVNRTQADGFARIGAGLHAAAETGTARAVDSTLGRGAALAKTGTATCTHQPRGAADGFAIVLFPASQPRMLLLVRVHDATGAQTAARAAKMLRALGAGQP